MGDRCAADGTREVFLLREVEGLSTSEAAESLYLKSL
jgi:DNA-directed RNA polymerase specialized sigma24 family protein